MNGRHLLTRQALVALIVAGGLSASTLLIGIGRAATPMGGTGASVAPAGAKQTKEGRPLYIYTLTADGTPASYDETLAVASLQGIIHRKSPEVYVLSRQNGRPQFWLDLLTKDGRWLEGREQKRLADIDALVKLAGAELKGAVIWDTAVPASVNVATTMAGVHDAVVLSPELADRYLARWRLPVLKDLRGLFTGAETGSKKNDAYRWAIREYLAKGRCCSKQLCLFEDSFSTRARGDLGYVVTRDWAVKNRAFVFDLSPWGDETPQDDSAQRPGLDLETYRMILSETLRQSAGQHMTELTGFFAFSKYANMPDHKSAHEPVPTEWETVWLISPYNCYQNTVAGDCFNQSLHSQSPRQPLEQHRAAKPVAFEKKAYVCILMADYDSATPLYDFLPNHWHNADRGTIPLAWGINPNLLETYPDLIAYFYSTASPADTFTADASAAGYMNPNRIRKEYLPLFVRHNQQFFREAGMTIAPMVLDWDQPSADVKDAFQQFSPDGFATIVMDLHGTGGKLPEPQVWKGMPVLELINNACNFAGPEQTADIMAGAIQDRGNKMPGFYFFRCVWVNPTNIADTLAALRRKHPELNVEVLDPHTFFALFKKSLSVAGIAQDSPKPEQGQRAPEKRREVRWNYPDGQKVPGVEHGSFHSPSMDVEVGYNVALPAGYAQGDARYPVIYFLHGAGGNENSDAAGFSGLVAKYVAEKKLPPAICVFPNGGMSGYQDRPAEKVMGETLIVKELIPLIDRTYRTQADRAGRVIAGFSMGGGGAVRLALKYPDLFSAAGSWAGAFGMRGGIPPELEPENLEKVAGRVRFLLIVGDQDMTYARHEPVIKNLQQAKYPHRYRILEGVAHNLGAYHEKTAEEMVAFLTSQFRTP